MDGTFVDQPILNFLFLNFFDSIDECVGNLIDLEFRTIVF